MEVVRYDERGCGLSTADAVPRGLEASVAELDAVAQAHGAATFALLGISGGAAAAVAYAARYPARVSQLVLLGGNSHGLLHRNPPPRSFVWARRWTGRVWASCRSPRDSGWPRRPCAAHVLQWRQPVFPA